MPHHLAPRLGSVCPNEGMAPWPSAAIPASMPGCPLRNACVRPAWLTGRRDQRPPRGGLIADLVLGETAFLLWERACSRRRRHSQHHRKLNHRFREQARFHSGFVSVHSIWTRHKKLWERACSRRRRSIPNPTQPRCNRMAHTPLRQFSLRTAQTCRYSAVDPITRALQQYPAKDIPGAHAPVPL